MIIRAWRGYASAEGAEAYRRHFETKVIPTLKDIPGYRGAQLLRRTGPDGIEVLVQTRWSSMEAVRAFAGADPNRAVVEPEARAVLARFDETVVHYELVMQSPDN